MAQERWLSNTGREKRESLENCPRISSACEVEDQEGLPGRPKRNLIAGRRRNEEAYRGTVFWFWFSEGRKPFFLLKVNRAFPSSIIIKKKHSNFHSNKTSE